MNVRLEELRQITNILFDHLESVGVHEFEIDDDYYWTIPSAQLYDPRVDPTELGLDQLTDNWEWLTRVRTGEGEPIAYHLTWLAAILRWIGDKVVG